MGAMVKSGHSYTGQQALARRPADPARWDMVLLEIETQGFDPFYAHSLNRGGRVVGIVTSGAYGHRTGRALALAYLRDRSARGGLSVEILGRPCAAHVLERPPYDPDNTRLKG
ncbi:glycine cleavage T C-terminal barrel domain-containing protein [Pelagivirga sediminicola]|uniref:glycine cleavage T C-terminal barrel domain-containing protein n=1 Tax=Pelagivirga sediminicola TaxID=2170575 RepID=UPI001FAF6013|nr:glycine cleavage T C-terminal barrel domain-containing protein [Pelagivirga sediminicola]